jgi:hypothetical protein
MNDLHSDLAALADEVRPAELLDRVYGTSRRLRRRRQALAAGSTVLAGVLAVGLLLPSGHEEKTLPVTTPTPTPTLGTPKAFVPPVTESGGRKRMSLTLPNGTSVSVSYPKSENFEQSGVEATWTYNNAQNGGSLSGWIPPSAKHKGYVFDRFGTRLEVWQSTYKEFIEAQGGDDEGIDDVLVWFRYGDWFYPVDPNPDARGEDLSAYYPEARKLRLERMPNGMLRVTLPDGEKFEPASTTLDNDILDGPMLEFRKDNDYSVQVAAAKNCEGPAEAPVMEWRGRQICKDGIMIRIVGDRGKTWQDWVKNLASTLRIEKVTEP